MRRYLTIILALFIAAAPAFSSAKPEEDLLKANYLYNHLDFHQAIQYFEKIAENSTDPEVFAKLGDCYRLTKDPKDAAVAYGKAITMSGCPDDVKLHYGQVLMTLQEYHKALPLFEQYQHIKPDDRRTANLITSCEDAKEMNNQVPDGSIMFLALNTDASEFGPAIKGNRLFFTSDTAFSSASHTDGWTGKSYYGIYSVGCNADGQCDNDLQRLGGKINTKYHDGACMFTASGKVMYFTRTFYEQKFLARSPVPDQNDFVHLEIMMASNYDSATHDYKTVKQFKYDNKGYSVAHPAISSDGNMLIFTSDMPGGNGGTDLYMCMKNNHDKWSKPVNLGKSINTEGDEMFPFLDKDNNLYFASDGLVGFGGLDIYEAKWDKMHNKIMSPVNLGKPVNSSYDDMSLVFDANKDQGYFASDRPMGKAGDNIYSFHPQHVYLSLKVVDENTGSPINGVNVALKGLKDKRNFLTDDNGKVFTGLYPETQYVVNTSKIGYKEGKEDLSTLTITTNVDTVYKVVKMNPDLNINYNVVVLDQDTKQPVPDPQLVIWANGDTHSDTIALSTGQAYMKNLKPGKTYHAYAVKDNFYCNEKVISTMGITPHSSSTRINDTLYMKRLKVGEVYNIDNIYYDFDKANIREDAKPALNRLIELLNKYPKMRIQINSHTDCRGAAAYNLRLSDRRAHSVVVYLHQRGISVDRLKSKGYGETKPIVKCPICSECSEADHQKNRRTEFQIISM